MQLGVAKSNFKLVIASNEMLEDALKRDSSICDVGSTSGKPPGGANNDGSRSASMDQDYTGHSPLSPTTGSSPTITNQIPSPVQPNTGQQDGKFFRFRFNSSFGGSGSRPGTPVSGQGHPAAHLTSPSMPTLPLQPGEREKEKELEKEMCELAAKLEEERKKHKKACDDKAELEDELESLSAALFEEANKMVATERIKLHETTEELYQAQLEKEALRSALKLIEGENKHLRTTSQSMGDLRTAYGDGGGGEERSRSRSSSVTGVKSRPVSASLNGASGSEPAPVVPPPRQDSKGAASMPVDLGGQTPAADVPASSSTVSLDEEGYETPEEELRDAAVSPPISSQQTGEPSILGPPVNTSSSTSSSPTSPLSPPSPDDVSRPASPSPSPSPSLPSDSNTPPRFELRTPEDEKESERTPAPRTPIRRCASHAALHLIPPATHTPFPPSDSFPGTMS